MKRSILPILSLFLMLLCTTAYAESETDFAMAVEIESEPIEAEWIPSGQQNSIVLGYGLMGYLTAGGFGAGTALDLAYYRQTDDNFRWGLSMRWFHDNVRDGHYIGYPDSEHRCIQIEMLSFAYHIQGFKRFGDWEFSIDGGFGLGFAFSQQHGRKAPPPSTSPNSDLGGGMDATWILLGFYGDDWDFFLDASVGGTIEYYLGENFSLGVNSTIHVHTIFYVDISLSAQLKVLF